MKQIRHKLIPYDRCRRYLTQVIDNIDWRLKHSNDTLPPVVTNTDLCVRDEAILPVATQNNHHDANGLC